MKFDKVEAENALLCALYDKDIPQQTEDTLLNQLYNRMRVDDRIDINMPRLLKVIAAAINKGYVAWGSLGFSSDDISLDLATVFRLTDKGIMKAQELAEEGHPHISKKAQEKAEEPEHAWDDEFAEYDDESDDEDEFAQYDDESDDEDEFAKEDYEDDAPEDYKDSEDSEESEDSEDYEDEAEDEPTTQGINSGKSTDALGSITPRTVAINRDEAYWVDTHDELTPEEYKDILGVSREEFKDDINGAIDKAFDNAIEYHENGGIEDEEEYPEDEEDYIEDEDEDDDDCAQFCHICGTIADLQDNFCCVCGNRLFPVLQDPVIVKAIPTRKTSQGKVGSRDAADEAARQRQQDKLNDIEVLYNMCEKLGIF